jgi:lipoprotein-releasing system ATP-binding protein
LKISFLLVTHDPRLAARCDRVIELVDGRIVRDERMTTAAEQTLSPTRT